MSKRNEERIRAVMRLRADGATAREIREALGLTARQTSWAIQQVKQDNQGSKQ